MNNGNFEIADWLINHRVFTYKELFDFLISKEYDEDLVKRKIYEILETSQIKRAGKHYIFEGLKNVND